MAKHLVLRESRLKCLLYLRLLLLSLAAIGPNTSDEAPFLVVVAVSVKLGREWKADQLALLFLAPTLAEDALCQTCFTASTCRTALPVLALASKSRPTGNWNHDCSMNS